ncbi:hypothetical protein [Paenibacillus sp. 276b]|uniref:hypothetical protein n=1 Tax=Paenibacillus sp. 276b TaxID=1566277 RepID=UPI00089BE4EC|nr:hypothetical protein [Paenibacillus sp. 276b]SEB27622.1 hypothetical protein SAMN03159332_6289 [Paenibacillus sp. 276b]
MTSDSFPPTVSVARYLEYLKELIKNELGLDAEISLTIHSWPSTNRIAQLVISDMVEGSNNWTTKNEIIDDKGAFGSMSFTSAKKGSNKYHYSEIIIYKSERQTKHRLGTLPRSTKKYSPIANALLEIRKIVRSLYGVDPRIGVQAKVQKSRSLFSTGFNEGITKETAKEILSAICKGTNWKYVESTSSFTESFELHGTNIEIGISFDSQ